MIIIILNVSLKILFMVISNFASITMFKILNRLPSEEKDVKWNVNTLALSSAISVTTDIILLVITLFTISPGDYGTGIELLSVFIIFIIYFPACIINVQRLKKKMRMYDAFRKEEGAVKYIIYSGIFFKCVLFFFLPISLEQYYRGFLERLLT